MNQKTALLLLAMALIGFTTINAQDASKSATRSGIESQDGEIREWIKQLNSLNYEERVEASKKLVAAGEPVIDPLFKAVESADFETSFRAFKIIKNVGLNGNLDTLEKIIIKSQELPTFFRDQFDEWSGQAIAKWKKNQSEIAVTKLAEAGASVNEIEALGQLGIMLIEDLEQKVEPVRSVEKATTNTVLQQIRDLKKELAGEPVKSKPDKSNVDDNETPRQIEFRGRPLVIRGDRAVLRRSINPAENTRNVVFGGGWDGNAESLKHLRFVGNLNQVEFVEQEITHEVLEQLVNIHSIRSLLLTRCKFSFTELQQFKEKRDKVSSFQLLATGAGYLGVYGPSPGEPDDGQGSFVSQVSPNSAASDAGLERGDIITQVDQDQIRSFADLSLVISSKPVGKEIKISIRRNQKEQLLTAKLKSRIGLR